ncbi:biotin-dependent carboxyltransferase family protein [Alicyclobacillus fodiniaquatilis]|uniref:Biotin-dependent carboxyltransferase family protein n=1 Tax=Alicyclobacillus fodiniaquatilis TaxID=1661150 RepID=A0ABW4JJY2_9BACL
MSYDSSTIGDHLRVLDGGLHTTLQDVGRFGYRWYGVTPGGAMDGQTLAVANLLVGNPPGVGALECSFAGPSLFFPQSTWIGLCGGRFDIRVDGQAVPVNKPLWLESGATLQIGTALAGARLYLAVQGGFRIQETLGSQSTLTRFQLGGVDGRTLTAGDILPIRRQNAPPLQGLAQLGERVWAPRWRVADETGSKTGVITIRALIGEQYHLFAPDVQRAFFEQAFRIDVKSDRMGLRLAGETVTPPTMDMRSEPVVFGSVQVPASGQPIILMADCQTTGGYPKIATVIGADLPKLAQARPHDVVRFVQVDLAHAVGARRQQAAQQALLARQIADQRNSLPPAGV